MQIKLLFMVCCLWFAARVSAATVDVKNFGANVDDGQDDTNAIKSAIVAAGINGTITFHAGDYNVSSPVLCLPGQNFVGTTTIMTDRISKCWLANQTRIINTGIHFFIYNDNCTFKN